MAAQQAATPQIKLSIVTDKHTYVLNGKPVVKGEFTNLTSKTLCFPPPDVSGCGNAAIGAFTATAEALDAEDRRRPLVCGTLVHGVVGAELDSAIQKSWIKLPPNGVYLTAPAELHVNLSDIGRWQLTAFYHPPENSYSLPHDYRKLLQSAAENAGCTLPHSAIAEPKIITVQTDANKK